MLRLADKLESGTADLGQGELKALSEMERNHILKVLEQTGWKIEGEGGAASILGLNPSTLRFRIKKLGIARP